MIRATMTQPGVIEFEDAPAPVPGPEEVLVRVRRIGVCGSDIHFFKEGKLTYCKAAFASFRLNESLRRLPTTTTIWYCFISTSL